MLKARPKNANGSLRNICCALSLSPHTFGMALTNGEGHSAPRVRFKSELEDHLSAGDAEKTLSTAIGWGRYAEIFSYDDVRRMFSSNHSTE